MWLKGQIHIMQLLRHAKLVSLLVTGLMQSCIV